MKKVLIKKAFTLVELLVVIAILAVLATVSIIGYSSFTKKAQISNDESVIAQMNTALQADEANGKPQTASEVISLLESVGFVVQNLTPAANGYEYIYNMKSNRFVYVDDNGEVVSGKLADNAWDNWQFVTAIPTSNKGYSYYLKDGFAATSVSVSAGIDLGNNKGITAVSVATDDAKKLVVRTNGDECVLTINAKNSDINYYGYAQDVIVTAVANASLHIYGVAANLEVTSGHVEIEETGIVFKLNTIESSSSVTNNGYIYAAPVAISSSIQGNEVGGDYDIKTRAQFEAFRDAVNGGLSFAGQIVNLLADITLKDGWNPIGEGARKSKGPKSIESAWVYGGAGYAFKGTFDGHDHIISNLNNKGFVPGQRRLSQDGNNLIYSYGLFGITASGAVIKNLVLNDVDIDTSRYNEAKGDCVGALVGFSCGTLEVDKVKVNGKIYGNEGVAGLVGRAYSQDIDLVTLAETDEQNATHAQFKVTNVVVNAEIKSMGGFHVAGLVGYTSSSSYNVKDKGSKAFYLVFDFEDCKVSGSIISTEGSAISAAGIIVMGGNQAGCTLKNIEVKDCTIEGKSFAGIFMCGYNSTNNEIAKGISLEQNCTFDNVTVKVGGDSTAPTAENKYIK